MSNFVSSISSISLDSIFHHIGDAICIGDENMTILAANENFANIYGKKPKDIIGKSPLIFYPEFKSSVFFDGMQKTIETGETTVRVGYSNNTKQWLVVRSFQCKQNFNTYATIISKMQHEKEKSGYINHHDPLTSLKNRFAFDEDINTFHFLRKPFTLIFLDLNKFKMFNESLGFESGDQILMEIAARIKKVALQFNGNAYRINSDQFSCIIPEGSKDNKIITETLLNAVKSEIHINNKTYNISSSIAYNFVSNFEQKVNTIISNTETTLKKAKKQSNYIIEFSDNKQKSINKLEIIREFQSSLKANHLQLYYQPQIDSLTNKVCGAEALIRWIHPKLGLISPDKFLHIIDEYGIFKELDNFVISTFFKDMTLFKKNNFSIPISLNLSSQILSDSSLYPKFKAELEASSVQSDNVIVEITENSLIEHPELSQNNINQLKSLGIKIALDDFGTGYSSINYLLRYPTDYLKIDKSFIQGIHKSDNLQIITSNIIKMAHSLGIQTIAEGVESIPDMEFLKQSDCSVIQGFFFSKPLPKEDFIKYVQKTGISTLKSQLI